ncbi:DUF7513 family protein [Halocatena pleomorpha]|uniref:DUF7513 domain-containing protein n=1 Tax=Halocatena pleomorpha TaxID=1785090 RepID=A0A3P3R4K4_9EURY|nr:hypothetical protein [Halocatena pleomorpha]RRJ27888.1 hypothetical protein EIK79_17110 [Halocatena pleomorpha]
MSLFDKYLKGWRFRTNRPSFESGEELQLFVTDIEDDTLIARVGDSFIHISDGVPALVGTRVRVRVDSFDADSHVGNATLLEPIDSE